MLYDPKWAPPATEVKIEPWQKALLDAADLIEKRGWVQCSFHLMGGGYCTLGAINKVTSGEAGTPSTEGREAMRHLKAALDITDIAIWNDHKCESRETVIEALRKAADHVV